MSESVRAGTMASEEGSVVELYVYDLTNGLASMLAPTILGRQVEGVWHTAVVVHRREFFYGGGGISSCTPGGTQLGAPLRVERLGTTCVPLPLLLDYLQGLGSSTYTPSAYNLLEHNCNHFSDEVAQFLCGGHVPKYILAQPDELLAPPLRAALQTLLDGVLPSADQGAWGARGARARQDSPDYTTLNNQIEEARATSAQLEQARSSLAEKLARKERRRDKKRKKMRDRGEPCPDDDMAEAVETATGPEELSLAGPSGAALLEDDREEDLRKRNRDPPIIFSDIDGVQEFEKLQAALQELQLSAEEQQSLDELQQYLVHGEGSWVLGDDFLAFIGRLLHDASLSSALRTSTLRCLVGMAPREDVSLLLHQDRRHHALLNYAYTIDQLTEDEQYAVALFMCNLFAHVSSSEWLLYISEWEHKGHALSNIRATTKVAVHATLHNSERLRDVGTALMYNIATKERLEVGKALRALLPPGAKSKVFDEVCAELAMAVLQLLQGAPGEEALYRSLRALAAFVRASPDVPQLVALVGPDPQAFRGTSARVDEQIDLILKKLK